MTRIVALEHVDAWCAGGNHAIDYDRLRARIASETNKAVATGASEQEVRVAYSYAETVFAIQNPSQEMFCEIVFRARASDPGWRAIFPNQ
jgi:molybdenum cofactor biosynthesis enzyme MoaA